MGAKLRTGWLDSRVGLVGGAKGSVPGCFVEGGERLLHHSHRLQKDAVLEWQKQHPAGVG